MEPLEGGDDAASSGLCCRPFGEVKGGARQEGFRKEAKRGW